MISSTFKLLLVTTLIFILNTMFYLPPSVKRKHNGHNLNVHLNYSETATESSGLSKIIIAESVKREGMKYILYWNEAYDSKGEPTYTTCFSIFDLIFSEYGFCCGTQPLMDHQCPDTNCYFTHDRFFFIYKMKCCGQWRIFYILGTHYLISRTMMPYGLEAGLFQKTLLCSVIFPNKG